ncbi:hypothetical protein BDC45DRAFT_541839 [Circinella umbellata]|nr:hypothetical protein BDC45DRAFT_541839 [Circinella umbellata]
MNEGRREAVEGAHVETAEPACTTQIIMGSLLPKSACYQVYCQSDDVCQNCQASHKFCCRLESGDQRCAWCKHRKQRCVMDTSPGVVPTEKLVLPVRMQRYFDKKRNNWLDFQTEFPHVEMVGSDDESLSWERGVRANFEKFVPCHLEWLYEAEIVSQDSSQAAEIQSAGEPSRPVHQVEEV